ncbi:MAG: hypothetical protein WC891_00090 [Actinomycetota bacterium]
MRFRLQNKINGIDVELAYLTIPLVKEFLSEIEEFIKGGKRIDLTQVIAGMENGSVAVDVVDNHAGQLDSTFDALEKLGEGRDLTVLDPGRAKVIELWQKKAKNDEDVVYEVSLGEDNSIAPVITISKDTDFKAGPDYWVDVELYLYGRVFDMGGKTIPNVHIELEGGKTVKIGTRASELMADKQNRLYKNQLVRISAMRNIETGELKDERFISFENYNPRFDEDEFSRIEKQAKLAWKDVPSVTAWLEDLRGNNG